MVQLPPGLLQFPRVKGTGHVPPADLYKMDTGNFMWLINIHGKYREGGEPIFWSRGRNRL